MLSSKHRFDLRAHPQFFKTATAVSVDGVRIFLAKLPKTTNEEEFSQGAVVIPSFLKLSSVKRSIVKRKVRQALQLVLPTTNKQIVLVVIAHKRFLDSSPEEITKTLEKTCATLPDQLPSI